MYLHVSSFHLSVNPASRIAAPFYRGGNGGSCLMVSGSPRDRSGKQLSQFACPQWGGRESHNR